MEISEDRLQAECVMWANNTYKELRYFGIVHIPNGGSRNIIEGKKFKAMGVRKGFPDLMILPPSGKLFFIEMKDTKGKQSDRQKQFEKWANDRGYEYYLIRDRKSFEELINLKMKECEKV